MARRLQKNRDMERKPLYDVAKDLTRVSEIVRRELTWEEKHYFTRILEHVYTKGYHAGIIKSQEIPSLIWRKE